MAIRFAPKRILNWAGRLLCGVAVWVVLLLFLLVTGLVKAFTLSWRVVRWLLWEAWILKNLLLLTVAAAVSLLGLLLLVWRGPWWFDGQYLDAKELRAGSAALVTGFRTAAVQTVAALGAGVALIYTARNYKLSHRGQVTDRFTKALERLGSDELYVRLGGVLALEQIVRDAPEQATNASQVLNSFIRQRAPRRSDVSEALLARDGMAIKPRYPERPEADVQAALTALTRPVSRRHVSRNEVIDLSDLYLSKARLIGADLSRAILDRAVLSHARLDGADLSQAWLDRADLSHAFLSNANVTQAWFDGANLTNLYDVGTNFDVARKVPRNRVVRRCRCIVV